MKSLKSTIAQDVGGVPAPRGLLIKPAAWGHPAHMGRSVGPTHGVRKRPPAKPRDLAATRSLMRALSEFNPFAL